MGPTVIFRVSAFLGINSRLRHFILMAVSIRILRVTLNNFVNIIIIVLLLASNLTLIQNRVSYSVTFLTQMIHEGIIVEGCIGVIRVCFVVSLIDIMCRVKCRLVWRMLVHKHTINHHRLSLVMGLMERIVVL